MLMESWWWHKPFNLFLTRARVTRTTTIIKSCARGAGANTARICIHLEKLVCIGRCVLWLCAQYVVVCTCVCVSVCVCMCESVCREWLLPFQEFQSKRHATERCAPQLEVCNRLTRERRWILCSVVYYNLIIKFCGARSGEKKTCGTLTHQYADEVVVDDFPLECVSFACVCGSRVCVVPTHTHCYTCTRRYSDSAEVKVLRQRCRL